MKVYGASVIKGLLYTLKTFVETYVEDFKRLGGNKTEHERHGLRSFEEGVVTVQYPEAPMPIGSTYERFRVLPMLVYDQLPPGEVSPAPAETRAAKEYADKNIRCTACGICAKVCPPQCIWIVQESDDKGKPITVPKDFYIDTSVCMNCGMCAEFCPFDAIKMDHQFALNTTEKRRESYLYDMERLLVPAEYYAQLHPKANAEEEAVRKAEAEAKAAKEAAKKEAAAKKAAEAAAAPAGEAAPAADAKPVDPEREARIAAAKAKAAAAKAAKEAGGAAPAETADGSANAEAKPVDPEREARIAAAKAKAAEAKAKKEAEKAAAAGGAVTEAPAEAPAAEALHAEAPADASAAPAEKPVDPEREARIAAARARAAEVKARREAEMAADDAAKAAAANGAATTVTGSGSANADTATIDVAQVLQPIDQPVDGPYDPEREAQIVAEKAQAVEAAHAEAAAPEVTVAEVTVPEPVSEPVAESPVVGVDKPEQTTEKESGTMDHQSASNQDALRAGIKQGADESEAIAENDPVFTDPAPTGEIGQEPKIKPAKAGDTEVPPPVSDGENQSQSTSGDARAKQPPRLQPVGEASDENVALAIGGLGTAAGDEFSAASAHGADEKPAPKDPIVKAQASDVAMASSVSLSAEAGSDPLGDAAHLAQEASASLAQLADQASADAADKRDAKESDQTS